MDLETPTPILISRAAERDAERTFIEVAGTDEVLSYGNFDGEVSTWAGAFTALGVGEDDGVATMLPNCLDSFRCWLGLAWLRAVEVPINPQYLGQTMAHPLNNSRAHTLVIDAPFVERLLPISDELPHLETVVVRGGHDDLPDLPWRTTSVQELLAGSVAPQRRIPRYHDTQAVIYTSGTTGPSKGVLQPWVNLHGMALGVFPDDKPGQYPDGATFTCWPTFHSSGKFGLAIAPLFDLRLVFRAQFSLEAFWPDVRHHHITHAPLLVVSSMLMAQPEQAGDADNPMEKVGMYPLIPDYRAFERRFGVKVHAGFGNTEVGWVASTTDPVHMHANGRPMPGYQIRIANEVGEELPTGEIGEILVRHELPWRLNKGYLGMPEATAEAWRDGWFHTGDAGKFDEDGDLYFVDRIKDSLRRRGHNLSSFEIEAEVLAHPEVAECACVGVPSDLAQDDDVVPDDDVKVFVVRQAGSTLDAASLVEFLQPRAPRFMIPRYIQFVGALPRTPTGKVRKVDLRAVGNDDAWDRTTAS